MIGRILRLFRRNHRLERFDAVRHMDANAAAKRAAIAANQADVLAVLRGGRP